MVFKKDIVDSDVIHISRCGSTFLDGIGNVGMLECYCR